MAVGGWTRAVAVNQARVVLGQVRRSDLERQRDALVEELMEAGPATYRMSATLAELIEVMKDDGDEAVLITDPDGRLRGILSRQAAETALEAALSARC